MSVNFQKNILWIETPNYLICLGMSFSCKQSELRMLLSYFDNGDTPEKI
jgi:hypothetical protein